MFSTIINPRQACDSCHRRKTRCVRGTDGKCKRCRKTGLACTFLAVPKKRGRKFQQDPNLVFLEKLRTEGLSRENKHGATPVDWEATSVISSLSATQDKITQEKILEGRKLESILETALCEVRRMFDLRPPGLSPSTATAPQPKTTVTEMPAAPPSLSAPSEALSLEIGTSDNPQRKTLGTKASASESDRADVFGREGFLNMPGLRCSSHSEASVAGYQPGDFTKCIHASTPAEVPHTKSTLRIPIYLSGFPAAISISIDLPNFVSSASPPSLLTVTEYLTAFAWRPSSSPLLQAECRELLAALSSIAEGLTPITRDKGTRHFLMLLSRFGKEVPIDRDIWVELCGLGKTKAVVRHRGNLQMIDIGRLATVSAFN